MSPWPCPAMEGMKLSRGMSDTTSICNKGRLGGFQRAPDDGIANKFTRGFHTVCRLGILPIAFRSPGRKDTWKEFRYSHSTGR